MNKREQSIIYSKKDPYFNAATKSASILGLGFHLVMLFIFWWNSIDYLVYFNILSVFVYGLSFFLMIKKPKYAGIIFNVCSFEVLIHACIGVWCLGNESNLMLFIWLIPLVLILSVSYSTKYKITTASVTFVIFFITHFFFKDRQSIYTVETDFIDFLGLFSIATCAVVATLIMLYFSRIIRIKEEIILREIYHRIFNNTQFSISIGKLIARNSESQEVSEKIDQINALNHVVSKIHRDVKLNNDIGVVEVESLIHDLGASNCVVKFDENNIRSISIDQAVSFGLILFLIIETNAISNINISSKKLIIQSSDRVDKPKESAYSELFDILLDQLDAEAVILNKSMTLNFNSKIFLIE